MFRRLFCFRGVELVGIKRPLRHRPSLRLFPNPSTIQVYRFLQLIPSVRKPIQPLIDLAPPTSSQRTKQPILPSAFSNRTAKMQFSTLILTTAAVFAALTLANPVPVDSALEERANACPAGECYVYCVCQ